MAKYKNIEKSLLFKKYIEFLSEKDPSSIEITRSMSYGEKNPHLLSDEYDEGEGLVGISDYGRKKKAQMFKREAKKAQLVLIDEKISTERASRTFFNLDEPKYTKKFTKWVDEELSLDLPFENVWIEQVGEESLPLLMLSYFEDDTLLGFKPIYNSLWGIHIFRDKEDSDAITINFFIGQQLKEETDSYIYEDGYINFETHEELSVFSILSHTTYEVDISSKLSMFNHLLKENVLLNNKVTLDEFLKSVLAQQLHELFATYRKAPERASELFVSFNSLLNNEFLLFYTFILLKIYSQKVSIKGSSNKPISFLQGKKNRYTNSYVYVRDKKNHSYQSENLGQKVNWDFHFRVQGHWRHFWKKGMKEALSRNSFGGGIVPEEYLDMDRIGKTFDGKPVRGKTWVSDFTKGDLTKPEKKQTRIRKNPEEYQYNIISRRWFK